MIDDALESRPINGLTVHVQQLILDLIERNRAYLSAQWVDSRAALESNRTMLAAYDAAIRQVKALPVI